MSLLWTVVLLVVVCTHARAAVINGFPASKEEFPQVVRYGSCVGTLISDRWAISAAHCYRPWYTTLTVLSLPSDEMYRSLKRSVVHPGYRLGDNFDASGAKTEVWATYDYVLLELRQPLRSARSLPVEGAAEPPPGTRAFFPSLDTFSELNTTTEPDFYKGELFTISDDECARRLQSYDPVTMVCAESRAPSHSGACYGDSGSGLVADGRLLGVLSWVQHDAVDCGPDRVVVAARLTAPPVMEWIRNITRGAAQETNVVGEREIEQARAAVPDVIRVATLPPVTEFARTKKNVQEE